MLNVMNGEEELRLFSKLLSHDEDVIQQFYAVVNDKQRKSLKVPTIDKMNAALKGKLSVFTHSNRLIEPRVETTTMASYSNKGDVNAFSESLETFVDLTGNAANSPAYQLMLTEYTIDGRKTNLLQALQNGREVTSLFGHNLRAEQFGFDIYDKRVFIPNNNSYFVALPRTPAWKTIGVLNAQKALFEQEILVSKPNLGNEGFVLNSKLRVGDIMQGQNASYFTGKTGSQCHHSVFLPPSKNHTIIKRVLKMIEKSGISEKAMLVLLKDVVSESGVIYELAQQMHRVHASDDVKGKTCPDNASTRMSFEKLGRMAYSAMSIITEYDDEENNFSLFIDQKKEDLAELSWTRVHYKMPKNYIFDGAKTSFMSGFNSDELTEDDSQESELPSMQKKESIERKHEGSFLRITMNVDGYDAGTNGFSLGPVPPVAIYGWLHNVLERNVGIKFKRFTPLYKSIHLHDQACLKAKDTTLISKKTYDSNSIDIDKAIQSGVAFNHSWLYVVQEKTMSTRSGTGDRSGLNDKGEHNPSMRMDVQASAQLAVIVELEHALASTEATILVKKITREVKKTRLNGGIIHVRDVSIHAAEPKAKGFALKRKEVTSLTHWLKQISFINKDYIGDLPTGLLATGYDAIESAPDMIHKGESFPACVVETVYKGFSFVKSSNQEKAWFRANVDSSTNNFYFSLIK